MITSSSPEIAQRARSKRRSKSGWSLPRPSIPARRSFRSLGTCRFRKKLNGVPQDVWLPTRVRASRGRVSFHGRTKPTGFMKYCVCPPLPPQYQSASCASSLGTGKPGQFPGFSQPGAGRPEARKLSQGIDGVICARGEQSRNIARTDLHDDQWQHSSPSRTKTPVTSSLSHGLVSA